jgi:hypothetical protein
MRFFRFYTWNCCTEFLEHTPENSHSSYLFECSLNQLNLHFNFNWFFHQFFNLIGKTMSMLTWDFNQIWLQIHSNFIEVHSIHHFYLNLQLFLFDFHPHNWHMSLLFRSSDKPIDFPSTPATLTVWVLSFKMKKLPS